MRNTEYKYTFDLFPRQQGETAGLAPSKCNRIHLPSPLQLTDSYVISHLFNLHTTEVKKQQAVVLQGLIRAMCHFLGHSGFLVSHCVATKR